MECGNGGLSVRNVDKMLAITENNMNEININEDVFFSLFCLKKNYKLPSLEEAMKFSVETIYYENPCGLHKPWLSVFPSNEAYIKMLSKRFNINSFIQI